MIKVKTCDFDKLVISKTFLKEREFNNIDLDNFPEKIKCKELVNFIENSKNIKDSLSYLCRLKDILPFAKVETVEEIGVKDFISSTTLNTSQYIVLNDKEIVLEDKTLVFKGDVCIYGNLTLKGFSNLIAGNLTIHGKLTILDSSLIQCEKEISAKSIITSLDFKNRARLEAITIICQNLNLSGYVCIKGNCVTQSMELCDFTKIYGNIIAEDKICIVDHAIVYGNVIADIVENYGDTEISGDVVAKVKLILNSTEELGDDYLPVIKGQIRTPFITDNSIYNLNYYEEQ